MAKPRRKSDIRATALANVAALRDAARLRAAFLQPQPVSWHDVFLHAVRGGQSVTAATRAAGVTKSGVYFARAHTPGFARAGKRPRYRHRRRGGHLGCKNRASVQR